MDRRFSSFRIHTYIPCSFAICMYGGIKHHHKLIILCHIFDANARTRLRYGLCSTRKVNAPSGIHRVHKYENCIHDRSGMSVVYTQMLLYIRCHIFMMNVDNKFVRACVCLLYLCVFMYTMRNYNNSSVECKQPERERAEKKRALLLLLFDGRKASNSCMQKSINLKPVGSMYG